MKSTIIFALLAVLFATISSAATLYKRSYSIHVKSASSFCSFVPPHPGDNVADTENEGIPMCTSSSLGGKKFPTGFIRSAHFVSTSNYAQVTGRIDRTKYKLKSSDGGGQYDNRDIHGVTCNGYKYFVNLIEPDAQVFCIRCCKSQSECNLGLSTDGCERVVPGNYN